MHRARMDVLRGGRCVIVPLSSITSLRSMRRVLLWTALCLLRHLTSENWQGSGPNAGQSED
jgi:hypothetical protein